MSTRCMCEHLETFNAEQTSVAQTVELDGQLDGR
jgi:hypothetical protein